MKLPTEYPRNYVIGYDTFEEMFKDYMTVSGQMEFIKQYNGEIDYDISISIGDDDYVLNITLWKI